MTGAAAPRATTARKRGVKYFQAVATKKSGPSARSGVHLLWACTPPTNLQTALNSFGYAPPLAVDGQYGDATKAAIKWFQAKHSLKS